MSESRLPIHPYAQLFPPLSSAEFDVLCGAILDRGLLEDIVIHEGKILDGWHRYLACLAKRVPPRFRPYAGECGSPLAFVVAKNLHRRHLTESQRAYVAAQLKPLFEEEARQRQRGGLKQGNQPPVGPNLAQREEGERKGRSAQKAAQLMKVSRNSVKAADKVKKQGVPQLVDAVAAGKISVSAAARIAALPAEQQQVVVGGIESGLKPKQARPSAGPVRQGPGRLGGRRWLAFSRKNPPGLPAARGAADSVPAGAQRRFAANGNAESRLFIPNGNAECPLFPPQSISSPRHARRIAMVLSLVNK